MSKSPLWADNVYIPPRELPEQLEFQLTASVDLGDEDLPELTLWAYMGDYAFTWECYPLDDDELPTIEAAIEAHRVEFLQEAAECMKRLVK